MTNGASLSYQPPVPHPEESAMQHYLELVDGKTSKFWRIETLDAELVTHWGKIGTAGRAAIKEYDSAEDCEVAAQKLLDSKLNKGYAKASFDPAQHRFFDTEDYGLHPLTSHPQFREFFADEIYFDEGDEETPFGSDDGHDAYSHYADNLRDKHPVELTQYPQHLVEREWEMPYLPPSPNPTRESFEQDLAKAKGQVSATIAPRAVIQCDRAILATTLGAIKITGDAAPEAIALAINAVDRMIVFWEYEGETVAEDNLLYQVRADLTRFAEHRK